MSRFDVCNLDVYLVRIADEGDRYVDNHLIAGEVGLKKEDLQGAYLFQGRIISVQAIGTLKGNKVLADIVKGESDIDGYVSQEIDLNPFYEGE